jgi:hypothetical protein
VWSPEHENRCLVFASQKPHLGPSPPWTTYHHHPHRRRSATISPQRHHLRTNRPPPMPMPTRILRPPNHSHTPPLRQDRHPFIIQSPPPLPSRRWRRTYHAEVLPSHHERCAVVDAQAQFPCVSPQHLIEVGRPWHAVGLRAVEVGARHARQETQAWHAHVLPAPRRRQQQHRRRWLGQRGRRRHRRRHRRRRRWWRRR